MCAQRYITIAYWSPARGLHGPGRLLRGPRSPSLPCLATGCHLEVETTIVLLYDHETYRIEIESTVSIWWSSFFFVLCPDVYHSLDRHPFRIRRSRIETQSESQQDLGVSLGGVRLYNGSSNECSY